MLKYQFSYEKYFGLFEVAVKKIGIRSVLFLPGVGGSIHVWKKTCLFSPL